MASNYDSDEELDSSNVEKKLETNERNLPRRSSRVEKLRSKTALVCDQESRSSDDTGEEMESNANETSDAPGSSKIHSRLYKCPQCMKQYKNAKTLNSHMGVHDKNKQIKCELCQDKVFARKQEYKQHMLSHTGEKPHECPTCNSCFGRLESLKMHQYTHLQGKTFECPECPVARYFRTPKQLRNHMIIHKKEKQHECSICPKKFHRKANLEEHKRVHTKVKPFECGICTRRFGHSGALKRHIRAHVGVYPYTCVMCDKPFINTSNCTRHMKICARLLEKRQHK